MDYPQPNKAIIAISAITILGGLTVITGWIFNIPLLESIVPGFVAMKFNAALCFVFLGCALLLTQRPLSKYPVTAFIILSLLSAFVGFVTVLQDIFHFNSGLDQLFITDKTPISAEFPVPGRMALNASVSFFFVGTGFFALASNKSIHYKISQLFFQGVTIISAIVLIGYMYGARLFSTLFYVTSMATHTAILFFILSLAAALLNPSIGIASLFTGTGVGNKMAKRLFILMALMIMLFGSLHQQVQAQHFRLFSLETAVSLLAICFLLVSLVIIWHTANWLNRIDAQRSAAEAEVKLMNVELEKRVEERSSQIKKSEQKYHSLIEEAELKFRTLAEKSMVGVYIVHNGVFTYLNPGFAHIFGLEPADLLNIPNAADKIFHPSHLKTVRENVRRRIEGEVESIRYEAMGVKSDGTTVWVEIYGNRVIIGGMPAIIGSAMDITERKTAAELILTEKTLSDSIINSLPGIFYLYNQKQEFLRWNKNFETITGYTPAEVKNIKVSDIIAEEDRASVGMAIEKAVADGYAVIEARGLTKQGEKIPFLFTGTPIMYQNRLCVLGTGIDISSRLKAEEELRSSEQKYKLIFESNPLPLWMIAKDDLTIIAANKAAAQLYGYDEDELANTSVTRLAPHEDAGEQLERYKKEATGSSTDFSITRHVRKDGTEMLVQIIANDIIFGGRTVRLSLTNDVTEKVKAEKQLQKSEANLQTILKTTDSAYALFDLDLNVVEYNQKAMEFIKKHYYHLPKAGDKLTDFFPFEQFPQFIHHTRAVLKGNNINFEIDFPQENGTTLWYDIRLFPITNDNKEILGLMTALYDITERKNAEHDLKNAYQRIQRHIDSIKDMAWKQSHLIRSPLANLKGLTDMLNEDPSDTDVLKFIQDELDRMDGIIIEMADDVSGQGIK